MDYAALAKQYGGTTAAPAVDYAALAKQFGGATSTEGEAPAAPRGKAGMFDILSAPFEMGAALAAKPRKEQVEFIAPAVEALGSAGGAIVGTGAGPLGTVVGAGAGYAGAKELLRFAAGESGKETVPQAAVRQAQNVLEGATMETFGRGVVGPVISKSAEYVNKLKNIKLDQYVKAVGDKGEEIVNALRGRTQIVPGTSPTAGEVAAPAGSVGLSVLQARARQVPGTADIYASKEAQNIVARQEQEVRAAAKFDASKQRLQAKIDRGLVNVTPGEVGSTLIDAANVERQAVKTNVTQPAYKAAFDAAGDAKIDVSKVVSEAERILDRKLSSFATETAPDTVRKLLSFVPAPPPAKPVGSGLISSKLKTPAPPVLPPQATLQDLDDVRKAINADIAAASTSNAPMAPTTLRNLRQLHDAVDDAIGKSTTLADDAKKLYADAVATYRTQYAPRFKEGVNANLFKRTSLGEDKIRPEDVINRYFTPNGESEARQFTQLFGNNPDALKIARAGIEDVYRKKVAQGGMSHANFMRDYGRTIDIYDNAGMNLRQRFDVINKDAQRLARVEDMAKASGNKLAPALPPGSNALAVEARISELTKGLDNRQLTAINSVRDDLAREAEFERLASAGRKSGKDVSQIATQAGKETGVVPAPSILSMPITIYNAVVKRLLGVVDDKLAMELAREMLSPAVTAEAIQKAMSRQAQQQATNQLARQVAPRAAAAAAQMPASENQNNLAPPYFEVRGVGSTGR